MSTVEEPFIRTDIETLEHMEPSDEEIFLGDLRKRFEVTQEITEQIKSDLLESFKDARVKQSEISMIPIDFHVPKDLFISRNCHDDNVLCIDVGGSTIRIAILSIITEKNLFKNATILKQVKYVLQEDEKRMDYRFFQKLAKKVKTLLDDEKFEVKNVGITWSFPLDSENKILNLGKGFELDPTLCHTPLEVLILNGFKEEGIIQNLNIKAIINDSIAVYLSSLLQTTKSNISLIIGTGLNSSILIDQENQLLNTELGFFGKLFNITKYDLNIYSNWQNPPNFPYLTQDNNNQLFQPLEFLTSSRYICEILRLVLIDLITINLIQPIYELLKISYELHGEFITLFTESSTLIDIQSKFQSKYDIVLTFKEISIIKEAIDIILERSSKYVSSSLLTLDEFINDYDEISKSDKINVHFIGSFLENCHEYQKKIIKNSHNRISLEKIDDSSIIGAGVAAFIKCYTNN